MNNLLLLIAAAAAKYDMCPYVITAVIQTESQFDTAAVGPVGELGLMQLRPEFYLQVNEDPKVLLDPQVNIDRGTKLLNSLMKRCKHKKDLQFVLCYNLGVTGASRIKNPHEFSYYKKVKANYERAKEQKVFDTESEGTWPQMESQTQK
jgi:soluble lytic murein transglycosylase-like protein